MLSKPLNIDLYNKTWFDKPPRTSKPLFEYNHPTLAFPECSPSPFPSVSDLHDVSKTPYVPPSIDQFPDTDILSPLSPLVLFNSLPNSNSLFFIRYTPEDTFKQRWFLVQINYEETALLKMNPETTGDYHVNFLARHPDDTHLCDDKARWWPEWHEYKLDSNNIPVYGARVLFSPKRKPNLKKYMLWSDSVTLTDSNYFIHGPFNYDAHTDVIQSKQHVALTHWEFLLSFCCQFSIVPPTLSTLTVCKSSTAKRKK